MLSYFTNLFSLYGYYTVVSSSAALLLKYYFSKEQYMGVCFGAFLYIISFFLWLLILSKSEISVAYPISMGTTLFFSTLLAVSCLGETLSFSKVIGILFIFFGIVLVARSAPV